MRQHTRRRFVQTGLTAGAAALAGCSALDIGESDFEFPDGDPSDRQRVIARTFVERVHAGEYEAAAERFTDEMNESMPPDRIESVWSDNVGDLGPYEEISDWGIVEGEDADAVFARVQCANGYYALQVTLRDERIAGLFFKNKVTE